MWTLESGRRQPSTHTHWNYTGTTLELANEHWRASLINDFTNDHLGSSALCLVGDVRELRLKACHRIASSVQLDFLEAI